MARYFDFSADIARTTKLLSGITTQPGFLEAMKLNTKMLGDIAAQPKYLEAMKQNAQLLRDITAQPKYSMVHLLVLIRTILARTGHVIGDKPRTAFAKLRHRHEQSGRTCRGAPPLRSVDATVGAGLLLLPEAVA